MRYHRGQPIGCPTLQKEDTMADTRLIGVTEAASVLQVSREHAHKIINEAAIERFQLEGDRRVFVRRLDVERLAEGNGWRKRPVSKRVG
jgi:hypothetical protein